MSVLTPPDTEEVYYPDSDGLPMSDNTYQFRWIVLLAGNADAYFRDNPNVFVAGDHLIYPVKGRPDIRQAPDVYVAFGPRKGDRGSYKVWEEGGVFPQVVFEVWSPNNRQDQMAEKRDFYEAYGAQEYYLVYPEFPAHVEGWAREGGTLAPIPEMNGFTSPLLGFRFVLEKGELTVFGPDGRQLRPPAEMAAERDAAERDLAQERQRSAKLAAEMVAERDVAERELAQERERTAQLAAERESSERRLAQERERTAQLAANSDAAERELAQERERAARLAAKLRELGIDPDAV